MNSVIILLCFAPVALLLAGFVWAVRLPIYTDADRYYVKFCEPVMPEHGGLMEIRFPPYVSVGCFEFFDELYRGGDWLFFNPKHQNLWCKSYDFRAENGASI